MVHKIIEYGIHNHIFVRGAFYRYDEESKLWKKVIIMIKRKVSIKNDDNIIFNKMRKIIPFETINHCFDLENKEFRLIKRDDYIITKSNIKYYSKDYSLEKIKSVRALLEKMMCVKNVKIFFEALMDIMTFQKSDKNKIYTFLPESRHICKLMAEIIDDFCVYYKVYNTGIIKVNLERESYFYPLVNCTESKSDEETQKIVRTLKDKPLILYLDYNARKTNLVGHEIIRADKEIFIDDTRTIKSVILNFFAYAFSS